MDSNSVNDIPDTGPGDPKQDPHLDDLVNRLVDRLGELAKLAQSATDLADHVPALAPAFSLEQHARVAVSLRECRDAVAHAKTRLTNAEIKSAEWFATRIATDEEDTVYKTATHSFRASAKGIYSVPNQNTKPKEFEQVMKWLKGLDVAPAPIIGVAFDGTVTVENFNDVCASLREAGQELHELVGEFLVPAIRITKRR